MSSEVTFSRITVTERGVDNLAHDASMRDAVERWAREIRGAIASQARPVTNLAKGSGAPVVGPVLSDTESVYGTISPGDPGWAILEYGTWNVPAYAPMRAGVEASGARFVDRGPDA